MTKHLAGYNNFISLPITCWNGHKAFVNARVIKLPIRAYRTGSLIEFESSTHQIAIQERPEEMENKVFQAIRSIK